MDDLHVKKCKIPAELKFFFRLSISEKTAIKMVRKKSLSTGTYTIEVMNLPKNMTQDELRGPLWDHFQKVNP